MHCNCEECAELRRAIADIRKTVHEMATSQAQLDAYITGTLGPALAALEATGQQVATAVAALVAAYEAGAEDLTPQLNELEALTTKLTTDAASGSALAAQISSDLPPAGSSSSSPSPVTPAASGSTEPSAAAPSGVSAVPSPGNPGA
jgi:hypothetical protein